MFRYFELSNEKDQKRQECALKQINFQMTLIPNYWEHPSETIFQEEFSKLCTALNLSDNCADDLNKDQNFDNKSFSQ